MPIRPAALWSACLFAAVLITLSPLQATERTHDIEPDDYFGLGGITSCALSPDGSRVAYVESRWDKETTAAICVVRPTYAADTHLAQRLHHRTDVLTGSRFATVTTLSAGCRAEGGDARQPATREWPSGKLRHRQDTLTRLLLFAVKSPPAIVELPA